MLYNVWEIKKGITKERKLVICDEFDYEVFCGKFPTPT